MKEIFNKISDGIQELFPEIGDQALNEETRLGDIPGYDSMAAVNLQNYLEDVFRTAIPLDLLNEEISLGELIAFIEQPSEVKAATAGRGNQVYAPAS